MARIHLHGALGRQFGRCADYQVRDAAEAVRALAANHPDFEKVFREGSYRLVRGPRSRGGSDLTLDTLTLGLGSADLHIIPVPAGAKNGGAGKAILGALIMVVAVVAAIPTGGGSLALGTEVMIGGVGLSVTYGSVALFGASMLLSGISQMLSPTPKANLPESTQSYLFSGPVNVTEQGGSVPLIYGRCWVGSTVVSSGMDTEEILKPQPKVELPTDPPGPEKPPEDGSGGGSGGTGESGTGGAKPKGAIEGAKGGKGGGGSGATEDANTLQSKATARVIDLLGEGEIVGLVDGNKSIRFDGTPLVATDGTVNFKGVTWEQRLGVASQDPISGFTTSETTVGVGVEVKKGSPVIRTIHGDEVDAARVVLRWNALTEQDTKNGNLHGSKVRVTIEARPANGMWTVLEKEVSGKTTSAYERAYRIDLRKLGNAPYDIRVSRVTDDATTASVQNAFSWSHYAEIVEAKFGYDHSALIALTVKAEEFGNAIPERAYDVKGLKIQVPSNYDPEKRTYSGTWDGSFKTAWTDNPAWVLYDLLTNARYGLGQSIPASAVDRWSLYTIGVYCDQPVKSGRTVGGNDEMEPRFTFNGVISGRTEAYRVLQSIASTFRGLIFWSAGGVLARADMPTDPIKLVTPANVIDGAFTYSGTALKARHTAALITFNDPDDGYRPTVEVVENAAMIQRHGWRPVEATAYGCTRRSQARRLGLWMLDSEQHETETVTYRCSFDHLDVMPGDVVKLSDPNWALVRTGGRLAGYDPKHRLVTLDDAVTLAAGQSHVLAVTLPDGRLVDCPVRRSVAGDHTTDRLVIDDAPLGGAVPQPHAVWILTATDLAPRLFRVRAVTEKAPGVYEVTALLHEPGKYARVEQGVQTGPVPTQSAANAIPSPTNLAAVESAYWVNGLPQARLTVSWTPSDDARIAGYRADVMTPGGQWQEWKVTRAGSFDIEPAAEGLYVVRITALAYDSRRSAAAETRTTVRGKSTPPGQPAGLIATGGVRQIVLNWINPGDSDLSHIEVWGGETDQRADATKLAEVKASSWTHAGLPGIVTRWYWVCAVDLGGNVGDFNSNLGTPGTSLPLDVNDIADNVYHTWRDDLIDSLPAIDLGFLDDRIADIVSDSEIAETVTELALHGRERFEEIKTERGVTDRRIAAVDTKITQTLDSVSSVAERIDVVGAQFDDQIALVTDKITATADSVSATATRISTLEVGVGDSIKAAIVEERKVFADSIQAVASKTEVLRTEFGTTTSSISRDLTSLSTKTEAQATETFQMSVRLGNAEGDIRKETSTRIYSEGVYNKAFDLMRGEIGEAKAAVLHETEARVTANEALAKDILTLSTALGPNLSTIKQEMYTWVDNSSSVAKKQTDLSTTLGKHTTTLREQSEVIDGVKGHWGVAIDNNGYVSGIDLLSKPVNGVPSSAFIARVDNFQIAMPGYGMAAPFTVAPVNGVPTVAIQNAMIQDAAIGTLKIRNQAVGVQMGVFGTGFSNVPSGSNILDGTVTIASACVLQGTFIGLHSSATNTKFTYQIRGPYGGSGDSLLFDSGELNGGNNVMAANLYYALGPGTYRFYVRLFNDGGGNHSCKNLGLNLTVFYR